ncbi:MAG: UDP-2,4-diacetamido-2,4,6-trideoxy-beta-L-altropyranose hydrolase [Deltaproteobacteria bacterium]|nr:UDP-2,4-diacetamido-2,4,6-trideoxy-beta-L-altropyranose hydrolase [Deltaproteobacteria bacterium]
MIRADGSSKIGGGHLLRCLALAERWRDRGGQVHLVTAEDSRAFFPRIGSEGIAIHTLNKVHPHEEDLKKTLEILRVLKDKNQNHQNLWVVLDGYHFDSPYLEAIHEAGYFLLVLDDMCRLPWYPCDLVLNPGLEVNGDVYTCCPETRVLSGVSYRLLRREFLDRRGWKMQVPDVARNLLVTLGAADSHNVTLKVVEVLLGLEVDGLRVKVVIGEANPHRESLVVALSRRGVSNFELLGGVSDMASLMAWADLAISGAGGTSWEMAFMGLPNLMIILSENQWPVAEELSRTGCSVLLGQWEDLKAESMSGVIYDVLYDKKKRADMSRAGRALVDGMGADRIVDEMTAFFSLSERARL